MKLLLLFVSVLTLFNYLQSTSCFVKSFINSLDIKITCTKTSSFNTIIITWKKDNKFIAGYGICGPVISEKFKGKILYVSKSFNESTILIKNVNLFDRGCYTCVFNFLVSKNNEKGVVCLT
ncbi:CD200-like protein [Tanapox virus]|uniref:CD200-like protein n=2 Tax=Tanapox virus TaxID=99000 RepID=A7XCT0_9POXV|nr:141R protein [Yaba-like disease virus]ABQ43617.1 CD200-like protein [Tanapox virus]ABQ43772.1 CD200-like protein [Tanapox virus]CAC21379.1 141R protein [Yaba-like disease virus]